MDAEQFRSILSVAKELGVGHFKLKADYEVEVEFVPNSLYTKPETNQAPVNAMDADEQVLAHIEKLKTEARIGTVDV